MTDPTNPNINPAPSNDETPAAYTGGTIADANQQDVEVTETFTTAMPQMPDLPPNPNGTMGDPYSAGQQATTAMPNVAAHTADPYTQPATANTPQYGQPASIPIHNLLRISMRSRLPIHTHSRPPIRTGSSTRSRNTASRPLAP